MTTLGNDSLLSDIPSKSQIDNTISSSVTDQKYRDYFVPYFRFFARLDDDATVTKEETISVIDKDVSSGTKESYLKDVFEYEPALCEHVVDLRPRADTFVRRAVERKGIQITSDTINDAQNACEELGSDLYNQYLDYHIERLQDDIAENLDEERPVESHRKILREFGKLIARELPDELNSFNQGMVTLGGKANEQILLHALQASGLKSEIHFDDISGKAGSNQNPGDLRVHSTVANQDPIEVEIKSTALRERGGAGISRLNDPTVLFGYFDNSTELAGNRDELLQESIVAYAPPSTLDEMKTKKPKAYRQKQSADAIEREDNWIYFRANTRFIEDMRYFYENGTLPSIELGHEQNHL